MSANNQIRIRRDKKISGFRIEEVDYETGGVICEINKAETLEEAVKIANDYMLDEEVEYGLDIRV